jgi:hypothetical protein
MQVLARPRAKLCGVGLLTVLAWPAQAQEKPAAEKFENPVFAAILGRVQERDGPSDAILKVAPLPGAPGDELLDFTIEGGWDVITLSRRVGEKAVVYEQYRLKGDDAMRNEWHNQET